MYKLLIKILSLRFLNSTKRKEYRNAKLTSHINNINTKRLNAKHKWGVSYSVFDGHELLEKSILSIRESVDYINVVYQTTSWYGNKCDDDLLPALQRLKDAGLIDELIEYTYIHKDGRSGHAPKYEKQKRSLGLNAAKKAGCTYFMTMDCDEFYFKDELENAKKYILEKMQEENLPVILGVSEGAKKYMGGFYVIRCMVEGLIKDLNITIPVCLHLDHGSSFESCKEAIDAGFSSVMIDASKYDLETNKKITKEVVDYAHSKGVSVEAEVGHVGGTEDNVYGDVFRATLEDCIMLVVLKTMSTVMYLEPL